MCVNRVCVCSLSNTTGATNGKCREIIPEGAIVVKGACQACNCTKEDREKVEQDACASCRPAFLQYKSAALQGYNSAREEELKDVQTANQRLRDRCDGNRQRAITPKARSKTGDTGGTRRGAQDALTRSACAMETNAQSEGSASLARIPPFQLACKSLSTMAKAEGETDAYTDRNQ